MTSSDLWDEETARRYDEVSAEMSAPAVLGPAVEFLARLAGADGGPAAAQGAGGGDSGRRWTGAPFTSDSESYVSVWRKPVSSGG